MTIVHELPLRVYMEDTDAGGIVYYVNYLKFMERARSEWLNKHGIYQQCLLKASTQLVVSRLSSRFVAPAQLDDPLVVTVSVKVAKQCRVVLDQTVMRDSTLLCSAEVEIACLDANRMRPKRWPDDIQAIWH